jgi:hypothetical protein
MIHVYMHMRTSDTPIIWIMTIVYANEPLSGQNTSRLSCRVHFDLRGMRGWPTDRLGRRRCDALFDVLHWYSRPIAHMQREREESIPFGSELKRGAHFVWLMVHIRLLCFCFGELYLHFGSPLVLHFCVAINFYRQPCSSLDRTKMSTRFDQFVISGQFLYEFAVQHQILDLLAYSNSPAVFISHV